MREKSADMSDKELIKRVIDDPAYFRDIVMRYERPLGRYLYRLGVRVNEDREDVLQEIFIKVYRNLNSYDDSFSFSSWIYRIAHNEAISWYRKHKVRPEGHLVDDEDELLLRQIMSTEERADVLFDETVNATEVSKALVELDQKYRDPIILRFFESKEYEEISDILQIPTGTVGTLIHRGKQKLRKILDEEKLRV